MKVGYAGAACLSMMLLGSCTGLRHATPERPLFAEYNIEWQQEPEENRKSITEELAAVVRPEPNNSMLWMRPTVALHNMIKQPPQQKGLWHLLKNKIGSPPVYLVDVPLEDINSALVNRLNNRGYFSATSSYEVIPHGKRAKVVFRVTAGAPHRLRSIVYADSTDTLNAHIARTIDGSPLDTGMIYDLNVLKTERARVAGVLRNEGWFHISEDDLLFRADTAAGSRSLDLNLRLKRSARENARQRYQLGTVIVRGDFDDRYPPIDTIAIDSLAYIDYHRTYRPTTITRGVWLRPGQHYSQSLSDNTSNYLGSYGVFKGVQVKHTEDTLRQGVLDTEVVLSPQKRWSLFAELNAISKSNNFAGPGVRFGAKDRDIFRGAELLSANINGRFEKQVAGDSKGTTAFEAGAQLALQIPRIVPISFVKTTRSTAPTTRAELGYGYFQRTDLYGLVSANTGFGYVWRKNPRVWHDVQLLEVSVNTMLYSSAEFQAYLDTNPSVQRSFEQQFIFGSGYTLTLTTKRNTERSAYLVSSMGIDGSGNLLTFFYRFKGPRPEEGDLLFGQRFSQFVRLRPELRFYGRAGPAGGRLVGRLLMSGGLPSGNSEVMPYVKQFFVGGTNSVRAFAARTVGPGTYKPPENNDVLIDQAGDIRFEANLEYRFPMAGYFKGALFADAGNIWLVNDDPQRPGGAFAWTNVFSELAVGVGFGLRFDMEVIVVRFDLAKPVRDPSYPVNDRWVITNKGLLGDAIGNIAIGYPF